MVGSFGMAGSLVSFDAIAEGPIGSKNLVGRVLSDGEGKAKVEEILATQRERVKRCSRRTATSSSRCATR